MSKGNGTASRATKQQGNARTKAEKPAKPRGDFGTLVADTVYCKHFTLTDSNGVDRVQIRCMPSKGSDTVQILMYGPEESDAVQRVCIELDSEGIASIACRSASGLSSCSLYADSDEYANIGVVAERANEKVGGPFAVLLTADADDQFSSAVVSDGNSKTEIKHSNRRNATSERMEASK